MMNDGNGFLSQEEIDALLNGGGNEEEKKMRIRKTKRKKKRRQDLRMPLSCRM